MKLDKKILAYALKNALEHEEARENAVLNSLFHEGLKKNQVKKVMKKIQQTVNEVNKMTQIRREQEFKKLEKQISHRKERKGLPILLNSRKGKVITRMSPSPSGPLHIGHVLTIGPNFLYVKKYGGKFYIRIEDTNPENIYPKAYKMIKDESKWLTNNKAKVIIQSDRIAIYYKYIEKLIKKKAAYICTCNPEKFKQLILQGKACPCRKKTTTENLKEWKKMLKTYKPGQAVLRFKSNLRDKNPAMRDFSLARINLTSHPLQKKKYRVWPLMNLAVTVDDIETKISHVIRGKDHRDNAKRQKLIYKALGKIKQYPYVAFIGRLNFKDMPISASKMKQGIKEGEYKGWADKRLPTVASLKKQGYKPEAFWKFVEEQGINEVDKVMEKQEFFKLLSQFNK